MAECGCKPKDEYLHLDPEVDETGCRDAELLREVEESRPFVAAARRMVAERSAVQAWMQAEGEALRLRFNRDCPTWHQYQDAEAKFWEALEALSTPQQEVKK